MSILAMDFDCFGLNKFRMVSHLTRPLSKVETRVMTACLTLRTYLMMNGLSPIRNDRPKYGLELFFETHPFKKLCEYSRNLP